MPQFALSPFADHQNGVKNDRTFSGPNANPNHNHIPTTLTLSLSLSLTLTICLTRCRPVWATNYGRRWSGVVGGDFSQTFGYWHDNVV